MRPHRLDLVSLVCGLVFVALAVVGIVDAVRLTAPDLRLLGPAVLVLAGVALVITAARNREAGPQPHPVEQQTAAERDPEVVQSEEDR